MEHLCRDDGVGKFLGSPLLLRGPNTGGGDADRASSALASSLVAGRSRMLLLSQPPEQTTRYISERPPRRTVSIPALRWDPARREFCGGG